MNKVIPYPCATRIERDRSLAYAEMVLKNALQTMALIDAGKTISLSLEFRCHVGTLIEQYSAEIHRLKQVRFTNKGVVEICVK